MSDRNECIMYTNNVFRRFCVCDMHTAVVLYTTNEALPKDVFKSSVMNNEHLCRHSKGHLNSPVMKNVH